MCSLPILQWCSSSPLKRRAQSPPASYWCSCTSFSPQCPKFHHTSLYTTQWFFLLGWTLLHLLCLYICLCLTCSLTSLWIYSWSIFFSSYHGSSLAWTLISPLSLDICSCFLHFLFLLHLLSLLIRVLFLSTMVSTELLHNCLKWASLCQLWK